MFVGMQKFLSDNKYTIYLVLVFLFQIDDAFAVFESLTAAGNTIASGLQKIIYPAATIGIACVCIGGMFGNFNWKWLVAILLGVFIIANATGVGNIVSSSDSMNAVD